MWSNLKSLYVYLLIFTLLFAIVQIILSIHIGSQIVDFNTGLCKSSQTEVLKCFALASRWMLGELRAWRVAGFIAALCTEAVCLLQSCWHGMCFGLFRHRWCIHFKCSSQLCIWVSKMLIFFEPKHTWDHDDVCPLGTDRERGKTTAIQFFHLIRWNYLGIFFFFIFCPLWGSLL